MRNMSFFLTTQQILDQTKFVTRRLGWKFLKGGELLMACEKCQGLKPGEQIRRLRVIEVVSVREEPLCLMARDQVYGLAEARLEGFTMINGLQFVEMFCEHMKCEPGIMVNRIEFKYRDDIFVPHGRILTPKNNENS